MPKGTNIIALSTLKRAINTTNLFMMVKFTSLSSVQSHSSATTESRLLTRPRSNANDKQFTQSFNSRFFLLLCKLDNLYQLTLMLSLYEKLVLTTHRPI